MSIFNRSFNNNVDNRFWETNYTPKDLVGYFKSPGQEWQRDTRHGCADRQKCKVLQCVLDIELQRPDDGLNVARKREGPVITSHSWVAQCLIVCLLWQGIPEKDYDEGMPTKQ